MKRKQVGRGGGWLTFLQTGCQQTAHLSDSGVATIFGPPCKQLVWAPGQMVTATTSSWQAPSAPRAPRGRGACGALATPLLSE